MLQPFDRLLTARRGDAIVGAFTCYDLETAAGVLGAAEKAGTGVILLVAQRSVESSAGDILVSSLVACAARSPAPCAVQLDHATDLGVIERALQLGVGAVMADGSRLALEENQAFVTAAVELARLHGAHVEAELGAITGDEDYAESVAAGALTNPEEAARFTRESGADCLAVSIGNVHGIYRAPPDLDWSRLEEIRKRTSVPLSLHGASGLADADLRNAAARGIAKVNVNAELRRAYLAATREWLGEARDGYPVGDLHGRQIEAVQTVVEAKLEVLVATSGSSRPEPPPRRAALRRLDHVAIAVRDTDTALRYFGGRLGLRVAHVDVLDRPAVRLTYLDAGNAYVQLVEPLDATGDLAVWIREHGEGLHHLCFAVDDVATAVEELGDAAPPPLARGRGRVSGFVANERSHGTRIECTTFSYGDDVARRLGWLPG